MATIIRKTPFVIVRDFIITEAAAFLSFFLAGYLAYYAQIYKGLFIANIISFRAAELLGIFLFQAVIIVYIFGEWYRERLIIDQDAVIHRSGLWRQQEQRVTYSQIRSVSFSQSLLGIILKYGTIVIETEGGFNSLRIAAIPDPKEVHQLLTGTAHAPPARRLTELLQEPESHQLEFKSTLRWDLRSGSTNRNLEKIAMKTIAAFLNSKGGHLVIGVDDKKNILGLTQDYKTLTRSDADGFENHFSLVFNTMIGPSFRRFVQLNIERQSDQESAVIHVAPSPTPVYLRGENGNGEEFFIRTGNGTTALRLSEAAAYMKTRFS